MSRLKEITFLLLLPTAAVAQRAELERHIQRTTLPNGLEVIVVQNRGVPLVTIEADVKNGSFTQAPEFSGLSHLYEHMFFKTNHATSIYRCQMLQFSNAQLYQASGCAGESQLPSPANPRARPRLSVYRNESCSGQRTGSCGSGQPYVFS